VELGFPLYISLIPVAIAAVALLAGVILFLKLSRILGLLIGALGILFGALFGPMLLMDRVVVDDRHIRQYTGFWFDQTEKGFDFDGIERVVITTGRDLKGREIEIWIAEYADGPSIEIDPGDLWETNGDLIAAHLKTLRIDVVRPPP